MQHTQLEAKQTEVYSVSRLNKEARLLLEEGFAFIWVEGEISNFSAPHSGHWYFCLKDAAAQVRCAMFRGSQRKLTFVPKDGMHVMIRARVSLYENRGEFQLIAEAIEERGEGKLRRDFEILKKKLEAAGLFDVNKKKSLPIFPKQIGVVTSATGAAIRDILNVLKRRFACATVVIYPTLVQGASAAAEIVKAIYLANQRQECDVLIIARGGGSLEDLWPFNEESVAHAIFQSRIPTISGVGHEIDFTIADFVADVRAPTPSAAAELVTPDINELLQFVSRHQAQFTQCLKKKFAALKQQFVWMQKHLSQQHPKRRLTEKMQKLDFLELTLVQIQSRQLNQFYNAVKDLDVKLQRFLPTHKINLLNNQLQSQLQQINAILKTKWQQYQTQLANCAGQLNALSPLATLTRGYAIATDDNHCALRDAKQVKLNQTIHVRLARGLLDCRVEKIKITEDN